MNRPLTLALTLAVLPAGARAVRRRGNLAGPGPHSCPAAGGRTNSATSITTAVRTASTTEAASATHRQ